MNQLKTGPLRNEPEGLHFVACLGAAVILESPLLPNEEDCRHHLQAVVQMPFLEGFSTSSLNRDVLDIMVADKEGLATFQ